MNPVLTITYAMAAAGLVGSVKVYVYSRPRKGHTPITYSFGVPRMVMLETCYWICGGHRGVLKEPRIRRMRAMATDNPH
jgi:hypothetical protein